MIKKSNLYAPGNKPHYINLYCPNCNHELGFFDLFPVFSYIFLKGKCRYCGNKIRPRYLILEILSGCLVVAFAYALKLDFSNINVADLITFAFISLYLTCIILISFIDKENRNIEGQVVNTCPFL